MAGMAWVRLDTAFPMNHKILHLVEDKRWRAIANYTFGLAYAGGQGTDGFIPKSALPFVHGTSREASQLYEVGLWLPSQGGWDVNGWSEFQPSNEENAARSARAKAAAAKRWADKKGKP